MHMELDNYQQHKKRYNLAHSKEKKSSNFKKLASFIIT